MDLFIHLTCGTFGVNTGRNESERSENRVWGRSLQRPSLLLRLLWKVAGSVILNSVNILTSVPTSDKEVQKKSLEQKSFSNISEFEDDNAEDDKDLTLDTSSDDNAYDDSVQSGTSLFHPYSFSPPPFIVYQETSAPTTNQVVVSSNKNCDTFIGTTTLEHENSSEKELFCLTCNIQFKCLEQLREHRSKEGYFCRICTSVFLRHHELEFHFVNHKTDKCDYFCLPCNIHFNSVEQLQEHKTLQNPRWLACRACAGDSTIKTVVGFDDHFKLENHFFTHKLHKCSMCEEVFFVRKDLICHRKEKAIQASSCYICDKTFNNKCDLQFHRRFHFDFSGSSQGIYYEPMKTDIPKRFRTDRFRKKTKYSRKVHGKQYSTQEYNKKGFTCVVCGMSFRFEYYYSHHMIEAHSPYENMKCTICYKLYLGPVRFNAHIKKHNPESEKTYFRCTICNKVFKKQSSLESHELRHEDSMEYCNICEQFFRGISRLSAHIKEEHSETTIFQCKYCSRHFNRNSLLNIHIRIDHPLLIEKPMRIRPKNQHCDVCGKRFLTRHDLEIHQRIHLNLRPFTCEICGVARRSEGCLKRHKFHVHTNERPFLCENCGKTFRKKQDLVLHFQKNRCPGKIPAQSSES